MPAVPNIFNVAAFAGNAAAEQKIATDVKSRSLRHGLVFITQPSVAKSVSSTAEPAARHARLSIIGSSEAALIVNPADDHQTLAVMASLDNPRLYRSPAHSFSG
jgi:hypothetical protein